MVLEKHVAARALLLLPQVVTHTARFCFPVTFTPLTQHILSHHLTHHKHLLDYMGFKIINPPPLL